MPLPTFKTQDEIPEAFRGEYEEKEGEWRPKVAATDNTALTTALEKERQKAKDEKKARETAEKERDDLKRAKEAADKGISAEELQKIKDAEALARKPIEEERDRLKAENRKLKLTDRVRQIGLDKGVMKDRINAGMKIYGDRFELADDGETIIVKDADGKVTTQSAADFWEKTARAESAFLFEGPGGSGSGADQGGGGGGSGFDPVAAGKKAGEQQKKVNADTSLAFK